MVSKIRWVLSTFGGPAVGFLAAFAIPPTSAFAAPNPKQVIAEVQNSIQDLITHARVNVTNDFLAVDTVDKHENDVVGVAQKLVQTQALANASLAKNTANLNDAQSRKIAAEDALIVLNSVVSLHDFILSDFVVKLRQEAGLTPITDPNIRRIGNESTTPIVTRRAMSLVVNGAMLSLRRHRDQIAKAQQFVTTVRNQYSDLSNGGRSDLTRYGYDYYFNELKQTFQTNELLAKNVSEFYNGVDINGFAQVQSYPCQTTSIPLPTLTSQMDTLVAALPGLATVQAFQDYLSRTSSIAYFYNGNPALGTPGWPAGYASCATTHRNDQVPVLADVNRALAANNLVLASQLQQQLDDIIAVTDTVTDQGATIVNRNSIITDVFSASVAALGDPNLALDWKAAVIDNNINLQALFTNFPNLERASFNLLQKADGQITGLAGITDPEARKNAFRTAVAVYDEINKSGFGRLLGEIDSALEYLQVMVLNTQGATAPLNTSIANYASATALKFNSISNELSVTVPAQLSQAISDIAVYSQNVANALTFVQDLRSKSDAVATLRKLVEADLVALKKIVSVHRFNLLYTGLDKLLLAAMANHPDYSKLSAQITAAVLAIEGNFEGLALKGEQVFSSKLVQSCRKTKKGKRVCVKVAQKPTTSLGKVMDQIEKGMVTNIPSLLDSITVSAQYFGGRPLSDMVSELTSAYQQVVAIGNSIPNT